MKHANYFYEISPNKKSLAILNIKPQKDGDIHDTDIKVFDEKMNLIWSKNLDYKIHEFLIGDNGDLFILAYSKEGMNHWSVRKYTNKGENSTKYKVGFDNLFAYRITLKFGKNDDVVCAGLFSEKEENDTNSGKKSKKTALFEHSFVGTFHAVIDKNSKSVIQPKFDKFDADFLSEFSLDKKYTKGKRLVDYGLADMIVKKDGSTILIAEQFYKKTSTTSTANLKDPVNPNRYTGRTTETSTTYINGAILVINFNQSGEIKWIKKIDKHQSASMIGGYITFRFFGHIKMVKDDAIYLIYNDNKKVRSAMFTKVSENGEIETKTIHGLKRKENKYPISTGVSGKTSDNQLWINTHWGAKSKIGIFDFNQ